MKDKKLKKFRYLLALVLGAILSLIILWLIAIIGAMNLTDGCFYRYSVDGQGHVVGSDALANTLTLKASANYTGVDTGNGNIALDPNSYGKWLNSNIMVQHGQEVKLTIKGEVSLCKAYIPINNLQQTSNLDVTGNKIEIPRVEDQNTPPVSLILSATNPNWSNLTELFRNDRFYVALYADQKTTASSTSIYNYFTKTMTTADCRENNRTYSPICGRYSLWNGTGTYASSCSLNVNCYPCNPHSVCDSFDLFGWCVGGWSTVWDQCPCYENVYSLAPEPYKNNGTRTYPAPWNGNISDLGAVTGHNCSSESSYMNGSFQNQKYFWFSADTAIGLISRIDSNINPTNAGAAGSGYQVATIQSDQSYYNNSSQYKIIKQGPFNSADVGYLQYKLADQDGSYADNTGGYVLNIKQTKCIRTNGNAFNDTVQGRGIVQYVVMNYGDNPNTNAPASVENIVADADGNSTLTISASDGGYLWLKIFNATDDYKDSFGQYTVSFFTTSEHGGFFDDVLNPLFEGLKTKIKDAAKTVFKNMTCYQGIGGSGNCTNFFNYIKGLLTLYIMIYGMMFLLGMVQISQTDLVIRVVKIGIVAGLMNDKTFEFFNLYVFDFVTNFSDNIMANISGYSMFSGSVSVSNPFMFMNEVFTKIFLSKTFSAQIMALLSMGINGVIYFILMIVCIGIVVMVGFRALAVYIMAYFAIAILIGLAPLFLTFILFDKTRYLFDNWAKFTVRYMVEPTVMLAGIIILTQLFTIYLDYIIGYSVCWKCGIPFKIPFPTIPGFNPAFLDVPLFCFNWFAPWGFDYRSSSMGVDMQNMVVLIMIVYCMWGYIEYSSKIVARLAGGMGGPSATSMGRNMSNSIEQNALAQVGLDGQTRSQIKQAAQGRLKGMDKDKKGKGSGEKGGQSSKGSGSQDSGEK